MYDISKASKGVGLYSCNNLLDNGVSSLNDSLLLCHSNVRKKNGDLYMNANVMAGIVLFIHIGL